MEIGILYLVYQMCFKNNFNSGRNNLVLKKNKIIKKKYVQLDKDLRQNRELAFYNYLLESKIQTFPKILKVDKQKNYTDISLIYGQKINNIKKDHIVKINNFVLKLLENKHSNYEFTASDYVKTANELKTNINTRLTNLKKNFCKNKINFLSQFLNELHHEIDKSFEFFDNNEKKINNFFFNKKYIFISPSDFGFHNCLYHKDSIFFIDFEFAGRDFFFKLILDFICQPDSHLTKPQIRYFLNYWFEYWNLNNEEKSILYKILKIFLLKWTMIIINQINKQYSIKSSNELKFKNYYLKSKKYYTLNYARNRFYEFFS